MARSGCYRCPINMVKQCELDFGSDGCPPCANAMVENVNSVQQPKGEICCMCKRPLPKQFYRSSAGRFFCRKCVNKLSPVR